MPLLSHSLVRRTIFNGLFIKKILLPFFESSITGNVIGVISLIVGGISLYYSIQSYKQAEKATKEAKEAAVQAADASKKIDEMKRYEELGSEIQLEFKSIKEKQEKVEKAKGYLAILRRLSENQYLESKKRALDTASINLERQISNIENDYKLFREDTIKALADAEGVINACVDILCRKG